MANPPVDPAREKLIVPTAVVVMCGWLASLGFALWRGDYTALTAVTPLMILMAGYVFGISIVRSVRQRNGDLGEG